MSEKLSIEEIQRRVSNSQAASWDRRALENRPTTRKDYLVSGIAIAALAVIFLGAIMLWG